MIQARSTAPKETHPADFANSVLGTNIAGVRRVADAILAYGMV